jgi:ketosteroid isomerase-like protein
MGTTEQDAVPAVARRILTAIETGDSEGFLACYAPGAVIWHNTDNLEQDPATVVKTLRWLRRRVDDLRYDELRIQPTPNGYVEQHVLRGTASDGSAFEVPACLVVTVADGLVTRLDEYIDSAGVAHLSAL